MRHPAFYSILVLAGLCLSLCSCGGEEYAVPEQSNTLKFRIKVPSLVDPSTESNCPTASSIGVFGHDVYGHPESGLDNRQVTFNGKKWYLEDNVPVYIDTDSLVIWGYWPYQPEMASREWLDITCGQTDYLYGVHDFEKRGYVTANNPVAELEMKHALAFVQVNFVPVLQQSGKITGVRIQAADPSLPLYLSGRINLLTGETGGLSVVCGFLDVPYDGKSPYAGIYLIPSQMSHITLSVEINGKWYSVTGRPMELVSGKAYSYYLNFDIATGKLGIRDITIDDWVDNEVFMEQLTNKGGD